VIFENKQSSHELGAFLRKAAGAASMPTAVVDAAT